VDRIGQVPLVELEPADAKRVVAVLVRAGDEAI
jgi:hypothetical protein